MIFCNLLYFFKDLAKIKKRQHHHSNFFIKAYYTILYVILYVQCIDILMWSPVKLDFLFYVFFVIYCEFSKN